MCPPGLAACHPPEFKTDPDAYTDLICQSMLPEVKTWWQMHAPQFPLPFVDVFCETGAFSLVQSRQILETAIRLGFPVKIMPMNLIILEVRRLQRSLVLLRRITLSKHPGRILLPWQKEILLWWLYPAPRLVWRNNTIRPQRTSWLPEGCWQLPPDLNPGTAWCGNMQFVIALACRYLKLTPAQAIAAATIMRQQPSSGRIG